MVDAGALTLCPQEQRECRKEEWTHDSGGHLRKIAPKGIVGNCEGNRTSTLVVIEQCACGVTRW
jgi:hypothetical protein